MKKENIIGILLFLVYNLFFFTYSSIAFSFVNETNLILEITFLIFISILLLFSLYYCVKNNLIFTILMFIVVCIFSNRLITSLSFYVLELIFSGDKSVSTLDSIYNLISIPVDIVYTYIGNVILIILSHFPFVSLWVAIFKNWDFNINTTNHMIM